MVKTKSHAVGYGNIVQPHQPVDEGRISVMLDVLAKTGSWSEACRQASPHLKWGGDSSFRELLKRSPDFASRVDSARQQAAGRLVVELNERALNGYLEPVYQKGERVYDEHGEPAFIRRHDTKLLELALRSKFLFPDRDYAQASTIDSKVENVGKPGVLELSAVEIMSLPANLRASLAIVLREISKRRADNAETYDRTADDLEILHDDQEPLAIETVSQLEDWESM